MKTKIEILAMSLGLLFVAGCAELDESGGIGFHPPDWAKPGSSNNHAAALSDAGLPNSAMDCSSCHGSDYGKPNSECFECHAKGGSAFHPGADPDHGQEVANSGGPDPCWNCHAWEEQGQLVYDTGGWAQNPCIACHAIGQEGGHPESGFVPPSGANFHGQEVIDQGGLEPCGYCHADNTGGELDFETGGWSGQDCYTCHAGGPSGHPGLDPWFNPTAEGFHGRAFKDDFAHCGECHGVDYAGGWTEVGCDAGCHNPASVDFHLQGWTGSAAVESTHGFAVRGNAYLLTNCGGCHGADYLGGWSQVECNVCHAPGGLAVHPNGWVGASANEGTHGNYLASDPSFRGTCEGCHGSDLGGGWAMQDCRPCHSDFYPPPRR